MSKREIAAAAAKKYILSTTNMTASAPPDRFHSVMTLITLGKAEEAENINREKFLQAILTQFFFEHPVLVVPEAITDPQPVIVTVLDNVILTKLVCYHESVPNVYEPYYAPTALHTSAGHGQPHAASHADGLAEPEPCP